MGKSDLVVDLVFATLKTNVGAAQALTSEAYALAREQHVGLDDVDAEVLVDRLRAANIHLAAMLCAMHDELGDYSESSIAKVGDVAASYRPRVAKRDDPAAHLRAIVRAATRRARRAHRLVARCVGDRDSKVVCSLWSATTHLEVAGDLLASFRRRSGAVEAAITEHRKIVLERRRSPGDGSEVAV